MPDVATLTAQKQAATTLLQEGKLTKARDAYFAILIDIDGEQAASPDPAKVEIKIACLNNLMALFLKTKHYEEVIQLSRQVLQIDPKSVKALYRQSVALSELELNNDALVCIEKLLVIEPQNAQAKELLYVVMDKMNPLSEELPPSPPPVPDGKRPDEGKLYNITRMPAATSCNSNNSANNNGTVSTASSKMEEVKKGQFEGVEPVPVSFGGGFDFMNPEWKPDDCQNDDSESKSPSRTDQATVPEKKKNKDVQGVPTQQLESKDNSAQVFLDEAERTRIKNQLFAEALQKNRKQEVKDINSNRKKHMSSTHQEVSVDEIVSKTVEELSLDEKKLVAKVESKKAKSSQKSSSKTKKSDEKSSLKKKKVVSTTAKTAWEMLMEEEEMNIKKFAASKASTLEAAKAAAARKLK